jgi:putative transposase
MAMIIAFHATTILTYSVELFFKWIKQNLKIKTFWGTSKNAVFMQLWVALIVSILLWIHKSLERIEVSAQRMIQAMKTTILAHKSIADLFKVEDPPDDITSKQFCFEGYLN